MQRGVFVCLSSMNKAQQLGMKGESLCATFLQSRGWKILERNLKSPFGEVDIICERQGCLWAVEVKTRRLVEEIWMPGILSRHQKRRIANGLEWYAREHATSRHDSLGLYLAIVDMTTRKIQMLQLFLTK